MNTFEELDEDTLKEEMKAFLNHKLRGSAMAKRFVSATMINESVEEFAETLRNKYSCSDSKSINEGEDHVQSNSSREQRVQELQTFVGNIGRIFEGYKRRYTDSIRRS